jgi:uncharacterized lipoprotein YmbA
MPFHSIRRTTAIMISAAALLLCAACSSPPSQLYQLSPVIARSQVAAADPGSAVAATAPTPTDRFAGGPLVGVSVTVPEYLDRLDIIERTNGNELKPNYSAQWAEDLAVTTSRAFAEDLSALLPTVDIVTLPSRAHRDVDYQLTLELTRFESDSTGRSTLAGRWSIADRSGNERGSGRVLLADSAKPGDYGAMAAAMSRNLASASAEIQRALLRLNPPLKKERAPR